MECDIFPFSASTLLVGWQEGHLVCKRNWMLVCWWWWFDWSFARLKMEREIPFLSPNQRCKSTRGMETEYDACVMLAFIWPLLSSLSLLVLLHIRCWCVVLLPPWMS